MSKNTVVESAAAAVDTADSTGATATVPLQSLTGADMTKAVRQWARDNGYAVADRGAIAPEITAAAVIANPNVPAPAVKAKREPAAPKVPNVYDVHMIDGDVYTIEPGRGRTTIERLARCAGVDVADIDHVTRGGHTVDVPRAATPPAADPWLVVLTDGTTREYRGNSRGRMSVGRVADALGIAPTTIESVSRGEKVYRVATVVAFSAE